MHNLIQQEALSDMIGRIYAAAHKPELWPDVLAEVDELTPAKAALTPDENHPYLNLLQPHLQRAIEISETLHEQKDEHTTLSHTINHLPIGIITVDDDAKLHSINSHAKRLLERNSLLYIQHDKLKTSTASTTKKLHLNIQQAKNGLAQSMVLSDKNKQICSLHIMPATQHEISNENKLISILITGGHNQLDFCAENLASTFTLTPSEGKLLCALLGKNHSLTEAAITLGISKHTARAQIKSIFTKTETNSQSELLKKVFRQLESQAHRQHLDLEQNQASQTHTSNVFQTITLNDGRCLEYTEYGDPDGVPVLYFHGIIHSRQQFHPFNDYAETHGIRIIAPERPGFGATSRQKDMSLAVFATDIKQLANHLNIEKFYVLGEGNGGGAALACAAVLPDQVIRASVAACVPDKQFDQLKELHPFERQLLNIKQTSSMKLSLALGRTMLKILSKYDRLLFLMSKYYHHTDRKFVQSPEYRKLYQESMRNALPHNSKGFVEDYFARTNNWDFQTQHISSHVNIWHGDSDPYTKIKSAKNIAKSIPNCTTHFLEDHGHHIFFSHVDDILKHLTQTPEHSKI